MITEETSNLAVFEGKHIRKAFHEGEWWFSIIDVIEVLVGGGRPRKYWNDLKKNLPTVQTPKPCSVAGGSPPPVNPEASPKASGGPE